MDSLDISNIGNTIIDAVQNESNEGGGIHKDLWQYLSSSEFWISLVIVAITIGLWILLVKISKHYGRKIIRTEKDYKERAQKQTVAHIMTSVLKAVVLLGGIIAILQTNGFNVSSLVAGVGIITAILGFALQDAIKDVICGMYIIADHYFNIGDVIRYEDHEGEVIKMSIRSTRIQDIDTQDIITISNRNFSEAVIVSDMWFINLGLSYEEDLAKVHEVLTAISGEIKVLEGMTECTYLGTNKFDSSAVIYAFRCRCLPKNKYVMRRAALNIIQHRLDEAGISIPYDHMNVIVTEEKNVDNKNK